MICSFLVIALVLTETCGQYRNFNFNPILPWVRSHVRQQRQWPLLEIPLNPNINHQGFYYYEPENHVPAERFQVFWNVPTFQCHQYGLNFTNVREWGIIENENGMFRGNELTLLYDPGFFPALLKAGGDGLVRRNGGVPQEGDLELHLRNLQTQVVDKLIPDEKFSGLGIIDFEHWRPVFDENFGSLDDYRKESRRIEKHKNPFLPYSTINQEAAFRFEKAAKEFMFQSIALLKKLRPNAKWGYYGFPLCFNYTPRNQKSSCTSSVRDNNDRNKWLFWASTSLYPSLYLKFKNMTEYDRIRFMQGRLDETNRVRDSKPVYPYIWFKYFDSKDFLKSADMINSLILPKKMGSNGVIIWGSSADVNSERKCRLLQNYLHNTLGPAVKNVRRTPKKYLDDLLRTSLNQADLDFDSDSNVSNVDGQNVSE